MKETPGKFYVTGKLNNFYWPSKRLGWRSYSGSEDADFDDGSWNHAIAVRREQYFCKNSFGFYKTNSARRLKYCWLPTKFMWLDDNGSPIAAPAGSPTQIKGVMKEIHRVYKADFPTIVREESLSEPVVLCKVWSDQDVKRVLEQHREWFDVLVQACSNQSNLGFAWPAGLMEESKCRKAHCTASTVLHFRFIVIKSTIMVHSCSQRPRVLPLLVLWTLSTLLIMLVF